MLCPFCLDDVKFQQEKLPRQLASIYLCPTCGEQVPALYAQDYRRYPPVVVSAVGFRQHGKTVYFATLFYALKKLTLARDWSDFFTMGLNDDSLDTVYDNARMLDEGALPDSTPKNFPRPTMLRVESMPMHRDCTLLCFDTGGECFEKPTQLVQFAGFVKRAVTGMLLISVADMENPREEMHKLLNTYIVGMGELGARTKEQHLIIVYTKADHLAAQLTGPWQYLLDYLLQGSVESLTDTERYMKRMREVSSRLRDFTDQSLEAHEFLNAVDANFKSVEFSIISALGSQPDGAQMTVNIVPRRILDPVLWIMEKSLPNPAQFWRKLFG